MPGNTGIWNPELSDELVETRLNLRLQSIVRIDGVSKNGQGELITLYEESLVIDEKAHYLAVFTRTALQLWF
jgi:hypothetical protein